MDERRFDHLTRWLNGRRHPRRAVVRAVAGGALAAALTRLGVAETAARCKRIGRRCNRKKHRCCGGAQCRGGTCKCTRGREESGGECGRRPICTPNFGFCTFDIECCSRSCGATFGDRHCDPSSENERCYDNGDCYFGRACKGFRCR